MNWAYGYRMYDFYLKEVKILSYDKDDKNVVEIVEEKLAPIVIFWVLWGVSIEPTAYSTIVFERVIESGEEANKQRIALIYWGYIGIRYYYCCIGREVEYRRRVRRNSS